MAGHAYAWHLHGVLAVSELQPPPPAAPPALDRCLGRGGAGPVAAQEHHDRHVHDGADELGVP
jgi:hypothetical protein